MTSFERQEITGNLMRIVDDAHYKLSLALFKFHTMASYFDVIAEERFVEVETVIKETEEVLSRCRAIMATLVVGEVVDANGKHL